jgi:hypothetical protein
MWRFTHEILPEQLNWVMRDVHRCKFDVAVPCISRREEVVEGCWRKWSSSSKVMVDVIGYPTVTMSISK